MIKIEIKKFHELSVEELYEIGRIRQEVFVLEQNCAFVDFDGKDIDSIHIYYKENNKIMAYIRVLPPELSYESASIGRVLVDKEYRGKNYARKIMEEGIEYIYTVMRENKITIGAQAHLENFYNSLGFIPVSEVYYEDGIPHIDMILEK